jgi:hypothetical protein
MASSRPKPRVLPVMSQVLVIPISLSGLVLFRLRLGQAADGLDDHSAPVLEVGQCARGAYGSWYPGAGDRQRDDVQILGIKGRRRPVLCFRVGHRSRVCPARIGQSCCLAASADELEAMPRLGIRALPSPGLRLTLAPAASTGYPVPRAP